VSTPRVLPEINHLGFGTELICPLFQQPLKDKDHWKGNDTMKFKSLTTIFAPAIALIAGVEALTLSLGTGVASASSDSARNGELHLIKDCSAYIGAPGSSCTFISSNLAEIPVGSKIYVDQAAGIPTGFLDSDVMINVATGDWAVGHCTLDLTTHLGLCRFSDGTGN
jgi:hypothetical protein